MTDDTSGVEVTEEMQERLLKTGRAGGHDYGYKGKTVDCKYGCGCSMGPWKSSGPPGVDPWGPCPNNPKMDDTIHCPRCDTPMSVNAFAVGGDDWHAEVVCPFCDWSFCSRYRTLEGARILIEGALREFNCSLKWRNPVL